MSRFCGRRHERPEHLQSMRTWREQKRKEAEERNAATPPERRAAYRREHGL